MIGSASSFSNMLSTVGRGLWSLALIVWSVCKGVLTFLFDSIFPPKESSAIGSGAGLGAKTAGGRGSQDLWECRKGVRDRESGEAMSAEEIRQKRLEFLQHKG